MSIIEGNKKEYGHDTPPIVHDTFPDILSKFFYVQSAGLKRKETWVDREELKRRTDLKGGQLLELFSGASSSSGLIKMESDDYSEFGVKLTLLKSTLAALQRHSQQGDMLARRMVVAMRTNPPLKASLNDLQSKMEIFSKHNNTVADFVAEMESVASDDQDLKAKIHKMSQMILESDHHIGGFKEMYKRFLAILG